jgi:hypothetical protein
MEHSASNGWGKGRLVALFCIGGINVKKAKIWLNINNAKAYITTSTAPTIPHCGAGPGIVVETPQSRQPK